MTTVDLLLHAAPGFEKLPDEEGTETLGSANPGAVKEGFEKLPDEEGTETDEFLTGESLATGFEKLPDEEGTETPHGTARCMRPEARFEKLPDEEGTETHPGGLVADAQVEVREAPR